MQYVFSLLRRALVALVFACGPAWAGQADPIEIMFDSAAMEEARPILVRLPSDYEESGDKRYPVLFVLNERDNFDWASYIVGLQASRGGIHDMLVVGLPATDNYGKDNYPFLKKGSLELSEQSQAYSRFIREEALPYIEQNYRINGGRFIVGHSLSGLMVTHMMTEHPDSFSTFLILSPSLQHAPQLLDVMSAFLAANPEISSQAYFALGDLEHNEIQTGFTGLEAVLQKDAPDGWMREQVMLANTDHMLAAFKGTYDGLAWMYRDYSIQTDKVQAMTAAEIIGHYRALSRQLGYVVKPRQRGITGLGWFLEKRQENPAAALEVLKAAAHFFPEDAKTKANVARLECLQAGGTACAGK